MLRAQPTKFQSATEARRVITESLMELRRLGFYSNARAVRDLNLNPLTPDIGAVERSYSADGDEVLGECRIVSAAAKEGLESLAR